MLENSLPPLITSSVRLRLSQGTRNIDVLFKNMQSQKIHMVIVVDEYGQTAGLVTMEDILEEIVGNIFDEHDTVEEQIVEESDGSYLVDGMTDFDEVCELLEIPQEETEDFDTLSGFLVSRINKIPNDGEVFRVEAFGFEFDVLLVENKVIRTVRVKKLERKKQKSNIRRNTKRVHLVRISRFGVYNIPTVLKKDRER